jgi:GDPmannose 4,6-dehydratase
MFCSFMAVSPFLARIPRPGLVTRKVATALLLFPHLLFIPRVTFKELVKIMVDADMEATGLKPPGEGKRILEEKFTGWHRWERIVTAVSDRPGHPEVTIRRKV